MLLICRQLVTAKLLNRDIRKNALVINIWVRAYNPNTACGNRSARISVTVKDLNDHAPAFQQTSYSFNVSEAAGINTRIGRTWATDPDFGTNGTVSFAITSGNVPANFKIDSRWGVLRLANTLDYEKVKSYSLVVTASDGGTPSLKTNAAVQIMVENANDNLPLFTLSNYYSRVPENQPAGMSIVTVSATDKDKHNFTFSVTNGNFSVDSKGLITTTSKLDRDIGTGTIVFKVLAVDIVPAGVKKTTGSAMVTVDIIDLNDNTPAFTKSAYRFNTGENTPIGKSVGQVTATDPDYDVNGTVVYSIVTSQSTFMIQPSTGILETVASLDFLKQKWYTFIVQASDLGTPPRVSTTTVNVAIWNVNTYFPQFTQVTYTTSLLENAKVGSFVATVSATDLDPGTGLTYTIIHGSDNKFKMDPTTGNITLNDTVDYESQQGYELVVRCVDGGNPQLSNVTFVYINLIDVNDNAPQFTPVRDTVGVLRIAPVGTIVYTPVATDLDSGTNAMITYSLQSSTMFNISTRNGSIWLSQALSSATGNTLLVTIVAQDQGNPSMQTTFQLTINILTADGARPNFVLNQFRAVVSESVGPQTPITRVQAYMQEIGASGDIQYALSGPRASMFTITQKTGVVSTAVALDRESMPTISVGLVAYITNVNPQGSQNLTTAGQLMVILQDFNDNAPVFSQTSYSATVSKADPAGTPVLTVATTDADIGSNAVIRYTILSGSEGVFRIDPYLGTLYSTQVLDPALQSFYNISVGATNPVQYPLTTSVMVNINVKDINDRTPNFDVPVYHFHISEAAPLGSYIGTVMAIDPDTGTFGQLTYSILKNAFSANFSIDGTSGVMKSNGLFDREKKKRYWLQVSVVDGGGLKDTAWVVVYLDDVNDNKPVFKPTAYTVAISQGVPQGTGVSALRCSDKDLGTNGTAGLTYAIISGDPHQRFQVSSTGIISVRNRLDQVSETNFLLTVQAIDGGRPSGLTAIATVNITTYPVASTAPKFEFPSYTININDPVAKGTAVLTVVATGNGTITYQKKSPLVPFIINWKTGVITVAYTLNADAQPSWVFSVSAKDKYGQFGYAIVHINLIHQNEHAPVFFPKVYNVGETENSPVGTSIVKVFATDADLGSDGQITYSIQNDNFQIDPVSGVVSNAVILDREARSVYAVVVVASDGGTPKLTATARVNIQVCLESKWLIS